MFTNINYNIDDIHIISEIILYNLFDSRGSIEKGFKYLNAYNLLLSDIDKLIKMNKLSDKYKNIQNKNIQTKKSHIKKLTEQYLKIYGKMSQREMNKLPYLSNISSSVKHNIGDDS